MEVVNFYKIGLIIPINGEYIGREYRKFGLQQSKFANPYKLTKGKPRGDTLEEYKQWLWIEILEERITKNDLFALKDKILVCFCKPLPCHGDILKAFVEYAVYREKEFDAKIKAYKEYKLKLGL